MSPHVLVLTFLAVCDLASRWATARCGDVLPSAKRDHTRWCIVHALANAVVSCAAADGLAATLRLDAERALSATWGDEVVVSLALWLHLYHSLFYDLSPDDRVHHVLYALVLGIPSYVWDNGATSAMLFFLSGVPGGILYSLVALRRCRPSFWQGVDEPSVSAAVNLLLRLPGVAACTVSYVRLAWSSFSSSVPPPPLPVLAMQVTLPVVNVVYYARQSWKRVQRKKEKL